MGITANCAWSLLLVVQWCTTMVSLAKLHQITGGPDPVDDAVADVSAPWRDCCRQSTPKQILLDLGPLRRIWKFVHRLRLSVPRYGTLGERVKRWTAWRQTLKSRAPTRSPAQGILCRTKARGNPLPLRADVHLFEHALFLFFLRDVWPLLALFWAVDFAIKQMRHRHVREPEEDGRVFSVLLNVRFFSLEGESPRREARR